MVTRVYEKYATVRRLMFSGTPILRTPFYRTEHKQEVKTKFEIS